MDEKKVMQEMFDTFYPPLMKQGTRSMDPLTICLYRGPAGRKCAVGWLIPDEEYSSSMDEGSTAIRDNKAVQAVIEKRFGIPANSLEDSDILDFLRDAQSIHDDAFVGAWDRRYAALAERYGLKLPEVAA